MKAHELLTGPELRRIFQVDVGEEIPEYEVVTIHHRRQRRSADTQDSQHTHQVSQLRGAVKIEKKKFELKFLDFPHF